MESINQIVSQDDVLVVMPQAVYRDPLVRLLVEVRTAFAGWGAAKIAPSMRGIKLALRATAARIGMPGIPDWWSAVPPIRLTELLVWLYEEDLRETFPPHGRLRTLIVEAAAALAQQEAGL